MNQARVELIADLRASLSRVRLGPAGKTTADPVGAYA